MCYGTSARPPDHGIRGEVASEEDLVLEAADGNRFSARLARPAKPNGAGVVILPDVRGLHAFYCGLARLFAEAGVEAIALDYFGRSAGLVEGRTDDFDGMTLVRQGNLEDVSIDTTAALETLRGLGTATRLYTLGFCFGGAMSWRQSADQEGLAGAVGFYGRPGPAEEKIEQMKAPLLLLVAGDDAATPPEAAEGFQVALTAAGIGYRAVVYDGAPHSFFDRSSEQWKDACTDAWSQVFDFMGIPA